MDLTQLEVGQAKTLLINNVLDGHIDPTFFVPVREWNDRCHNKPPDWELKLHAIDVIMEMNGVEYLTHDSKAIAAYVNTGDTYDPTVVYDYEEQEFVVTSWGEFLEEWENENIISVNCEDIAKYIFAVSHSQYIDWDEQEGCGDEDEEYDDPEDRYAEAYIDIRLQVSEDGSWSLPYGLSDYDQDHRGAWGSSSVGKCVSMEDAKAIAKDLIEQAADAAACGSLEKEVRSYNDD